MDINKPPKEFWVANMSNKDVSLGDLYLTIRAYASVNLLNKKHYYYTWKQIYDSVTSGSIFKKKDKIIPRKLPPKVQRLTITIDKESAVPGREKSIFEFKEEKYEELDLSDEKFAEENADLVD